jgi:hypothetical protein
MEVTRYHDRDLSQLPRPCLEVRRGSQTQIRVVRALLKLLIGTNTLYSYLLELPICCCEIGSFSQGIAVGLSFNDHWVVVSSCPVPAVDYRHRRARSICQVQ